MRKTRRRFDPLVKRILSKTATKIVEIATGRKPEKLSPLPTEFKFIRTFVADTLFKSPSGDIFQIEIESKRNPNLPYKMLRYWFAIFETYRKEPTQIVMWIGSGSPPPSHLKTRYLRFRFELVDMQKIAPDVFLSSQNPDEVLTGPRNKKAEVVKKVIKRISELEPNRSKLLKYIEEASLLAGLFDVKVEVEKMGIEIDVSKTFLWKEGEKRGREKGIAEGVVKGFQQAVLIEVEERFGKNFARRIRKKIEKISDTKTLRSLIKKAVRAKDADEFEKEVSKEVSKYDSR